MSDSLELTCVLVYRIDMALHVQQLCAENKISVTYQSLKEKTPQYYANPLKNHVHIRPTKNTGYYVSALHELGHLLGKNQASSILKRELYAWIWARDKALVWTETAEKIMQRAMDSYGWGIKEKRLWHQHIWKNKHGGKNE